VRQLSLVLAGLSFRLSSHRYVAYHQRVLLRRRRVETPDAELDWE